MKHLTMILLTVLGLSLQAAAAPALWVLSDDDTEITIFGTIHIVEKGTTWANAPITSAFSGAEALVVELDQIELDKAGPLFAQAGKLPEGQTMRMLVGNGIYNDVERIARQFDLPKDVFERARPWFAGMSLTVIGLSKAGLDPSSGVDRALIGEAVRLRKPVLGIETAAQQAGLFAGLTPPQDKAILVDALRNAQNAKAQFRAMQTAWMEGDLMALDRILNGALMREEGLGETLLFERNRSWAAQMAMLLRKPGKFFVAVGTAHLVGNMSMINLLEAQHLTVIRKQ